MMRLPSGGIPQGDRMSEHAKELGGSRKGKLTMPANLPAGFFALETTVGLLEQQTAFVARWIQLRRQIADDCPGCPGPPVDLLNSTLAAANEALRFSSQAVSQISAQEALTDGQAART
jgi:hypothetical protein